MSAASAPSGQPPALSTRHGLGTPAGRIRSPCRRRREGPMAKDRMKVASRVASAILVVLVGTTLYATSARSWTLQPGERLEIDCGATFHVLGSFTLSLRAVGDAG